MKLVVMFHPPQKGIKRSRFRAVVDEFDQLLYQLIDAKENLMLERVLVKDCVMTILFRKII